MIWKQLAAGMLPGLTTAAVLTLASGHLDILTSWRNLGFVVGMTLIGALAGVILGRSSGPGPHIEANSAAPEPELDQA